MILKKYFKFDRKKIVFPSFAEQTSERLKSLSAPFMIGTEQKKMTRPNKGIYV